MTVAARRFQQVDVFTEEPSLGNPVAVVVDGDGIDEDAMRAFAAWTNLSETTFLLPPAHPAADYRVRILTPDGELPFAGHPTLGSAHAWLATGGVPKDDVVVQECEVGLVTIRRIDGRLSFAAPPLRTTEVPTEQYDAAISALGLDEAHVLRSQLLRNGPTWLTLLVEHVDVVLGLEPDHAALRHLPEVGVVAAYPEGSECAIEVRGFADCIGVPEDPVTGSLNAGIGQWLIAAGVLPKRYIASQGTCLGRRGRVHVDQVDGVVWVGGGTVTVIDGHVDP